jgi:sugar/nucleoside kinase (ribokinase family)
LVLVDEMSLHTGGCAVNAATALARLGIPVEVVGKVGQDPFGDFVIGALQDRGVGIQGVKRDPAAGTSATMVMVGEDGERRFVHYIGANARLMLEDVDLTLLDGAEILLVAGSLVMPGIDGEPTAELLKIAQGKGLKTFLDVVWDDTGAWMKTLGPCMPYIDYFVPSLPEAQQLTGEQEPVDAARALLELGVGTVGLKMGDRGCLVLQADGDPIFLPAYLVDAVDATGAGDAFSAGFVAGIYHGWDLEQTGGFANAAGALCVTGLGATGGVMGFQETLDFMAKTPLRKDRID